MPAHLHAQARGQLGNGIVGGNNPTPQRVNLAGKVTQINCGDGFTAALLQDKSIQVGKLAAGRLVTPAADEAWRGSRPVATL